MNKKYIINILNIYIFINKYNIYILFNLGTCFYNSNIISHIIMSEYLYKYMRLL